MVRGARRGRRTLWGCRNQHGVIPRRRCPGCEWGLKDMEEVGSEHCEIDVFLEITVGSQMMRQVCFAKRTSIIHRVCPFGLECWNSLFLLQYRKRDGWHLLQISLSSCCSLTLSLRRCFSAWNSQTLTTCPCTPLRASLDLYTSRRSFPRSRVKGRQGQPDPYHWSHNHVFNACETAFLGLRQLPCQQSNRASLWTV